VCQADFFLCLREAFEVAWLAKTNHWSLPAINSIPVIYIYIFSHELEICTFGPE
jgi:hypothetical protein